MLKPHEKRKQGSAKERAADQIWTWNLERASPATPVQDPVATWRSQHRSNQAVDATAEVRCDGRKRGRPLASEFRLAETAKIGWLGSASAASVAPRTHGCGALTSVKKALHPIFVFSFLCVRRNRSRPLAQQKCRSLISLTFQYTTNQGRKDGTAKTG
jgi:hypothetical protein